MNITAKNAKIIEINVTLKGRGLLNFDSKEQYGMYNKWRESAGFAKIPYHENIKFSKANYYKHDDDTITRIPKLSGDWIRHQLFLDSTPRNNSNVTLSDSTLLGSIAHPDNIIRGYLFANKSGTIKRKSAVDVTDAELVNGAIPTLDIQSTSGARSETSMFYRENIGEAEWKFTLHINLNELKFISLSDIYDRRAVNKDLEDAYVKELNNLFNVTDIVPDYYYTKYGTNNIPEYGILLSDDQALVLVNRILDNIGHIHHGVSSTGHAWYKSMEIAVISTIGDEKVFIQDVTGFSELTINNSYIRGDKELAIKAEIALEEDIKKSQAKKKEKKEKKEKKLNGDSVIEVADTTQSIEESAD